MTIKLYWCRGKGEKDSSQRNFGDYLSPQLVAHLADRPVRYAPIKKADLIAIGSIMGRLQKRRRLLFPSRIHVWGTGCGSGDIRYPGHHHYHAVRGRLSLANLNVANPETIAVGDPGLLADQLLEKRPSSKTHQIGFIPHYKNRQDPRLLERLENNPQYRLISVYSSIEAILNQVSQCDFILSSSLHGLIIADSLGIPNQWLKLDVSVGSDFKFRDYYSLYSDIAATALTLDDFPQWDLANSMDNWQRPGIEQIKQGLIDSFPFR